MPAKQVVGRKLKRGDFKAELGEFYGTPKEVWGFETSASAASPENVARAFLKANTKLFKLEPNLAGLDIDAMLHSVGADHVILKQFHLKIPVHRAFVTVHVNRSGRVFFAKNRAMPAELLPEEFEVRIGKKEALAKASHSLPKLGTHVSTSKPKQVWFPFRDKLQPAWKFRIRREKPSGDWLVYVNAKTGGILSRYDNLSESRTGSGLVFDPSPITLLGDYRSLLLTNKKVRRPPVETYKQVPLQGLDGNGFLSGEHVSTKPTGKRRVRRSDSQFLLRSHEHGFEEVMVYYHVDASLRYLEKLGYSGDRTIFTSPVLANVNGTPDDNSWYSPTDKMLTFGTGEIDDAEDGETILHELGHAIQDAICHDFGQSPQSGAMGEGFGDYWAASFFESKKPERYRASVMTWDGLFIGLDEGSNPPSLRRVDGKRTYKGFDKHGDVHDNGEIWSAVLWDVRRELGREVADRVIIESHFQQDGFTNFVRGARAIIDADRNLEAGRQEAALRRIFTRRKIGPL